MSLINLLATLSEPHYPSMYLVHYGGFGTPPLAHKVLPAAEASDSIGSQIAPEADYLPAQCDALKAYIGGAVGEAYGELPSRRKMGTFLTRLVSTPPSSSALINWADKSSTRNCGVFISTSYNPDRAVLHGRPVILILVLTGFKPGQSTQRQRGWAMAWLVVGQYAWLFAYLFYSDDSTQGEWFHLFIALVYGIPALGGFVIVGPMMIEDEVCTVI